MFFSWKKKVYSTVIPIVKGFQCNGHQKMSMQINVWKISFFKNCTSLYVRKVFASNWKCSCFVGGTKIFILRSLKRYKQVFKLYLGQSVVVSSTIWVKLNQSWNHDSQSKVSLGCAYASVCYLLLGKFCRFWDSLHMLKTSCNSAISNLV